MHTVEHKAALLARVRRLRGQVEAIERALEAEQGCAAILQLVASVRGAVNGLTGELIEHHVESHVAHEEDPTARGRAAADLVGIIRTYLK